MDTQILNLNEPYEYIHCNGEVGKHIATMIVYENTKREDGSYELETHSHPIVKYWNSPGGVVWNKAELTDCDVVCSEKDKRICTFNFLRMVRKEWGIKDEHEYLGKAELLRKTLGNNGILISDDVLSISYRRIITEWSYEIELIFEEKDGKIICYDNGKGQYPIYCEVESKDDLIEQLTAQCCEWERFTDRRVTIHFVTDQRKFKKIIDAVENDRLTWDL